MALRRFFQFYYQRTWTLVINATVVARGRGSPFECFLNLFWAPVVLYRWEKISETMMFYPLDNTCCFTSVVAFNSRVLVALFATVVNCVLCSEAGKSQPNPTQPNPTQPNPTQPNSTQTNPTLPRQNCVAVIRRWCVSVPIFFLIVFFGRSGRRGT